MKSTAKVGNPSDAGWTNTNLEAATSSSNGRVRAVCYGYHNGSVATSQTILAAVEGEGVVITSYSIHYTKLYDTIVSLCIGKSQRIRFLCGYRPFTGT